jgi:AcrR family transcriptional regulator
MASKSEKTTLYILEKVAPIFNKKGYAGTSMKDMTDAVGLSKGAIYGNFENKEELAIKAFNYNVRKVFDDVAACVNAQESPLEKLFAMTDFYRSYEDYTKHSGGCPILNIGVDANNQKDGSLSPVYERLMERVREVIGKLEKSMADIIQMGMDKGEMKPDLNPELYGKRLYAMIQGAIFMTFTLDDKTYIVDMMNHIDNMIHNELKL